MANTTRLAVVVEGVRVLVRGEEPDREHAEHTERAVDGERVEGIVDLEAAHGARDEVVPAIRGRCHERKALPTCHTRKVLPSQGGARVCVR